MEQLTLADQRVLIREDFNVPIEHGNISSTRRLEAALPTLQLALAQGARVLVMSHLGRPREGVYSEADSLAPIASWLGDQLGQAVRLVRDYLDGVAVDAGELVLLENVRMNVGEGADDPALAARYAALCDVFVMDAFGTAHRAQASTHGVIRAARVACGGPLLMAEIDALARALVAPTRPLLAIVGGSKVSTKLTLLGRLLSDVDALIVGGGIANTFVAALGHSVGRSLYEPELVAEAQRLLATAAAVGKDIPLPIDVVVSTELSAQAPARVVPVSEIADDELIVDIGPQTAALYRERILAAGTVVWNGPVGVFEIDRFGHGTRAVAEAIADHRGLSVAGGGDTLAAIDKYGVEDRIEYVSTGGGAFLEFLEGQELPAIAALKAAAARTSAG